MTPTQAPTDPTAVTGRRALAAIIDWLIITIPGVALLSSEFTVIHDAGSDACQRLVDGPPIPVNGQQVDISQGDPCLYFPEALPLVGDSVYFTDSINPGIQLAGLAINIGLLVVLQGLTGCTPGKLLTGIRNVRPDGTVPGIGRAAIRWLLWIVDAFPYVLPLVGFICAVSTPGHRRLGDMAAKTFVVRAAAKGSPIVVPGMATTAAPATVGAPGGWAPPPPTGGAWGQPAAPPATSPDPTQVGWGGPAPTPGDPPATPAWPTPGAADPPGGASTWAPPPPAEAAPAEAAPGDPSPADVAPTQAAPDEPAPAEPPSAEPAAEAAAAQDPAASAPQPQWDEARGTYIQWDPAQRLWLQWDGAAQSWTVIPGQ